MFILHRDNYNGRNKPATRLLRELTMFRSESLARENNAAFWFALRRGEETLRLWLRRLRWRHELSRLDADQLRDVGLNEQMIRREAAKPFWQE
jgi:uncharacterized protein YjiS (DUF1127 family)